MAEEIRFFVRSLLYLVPVGIVYWLVSQEPAGTTLLIVLALAMATLVVVVLFMAPVAVSDLRPRQGSGLRRALSIVDRAIGFHERSDAAAPLEAGPEVVPLGSPWPVLAAAGMVIVGLGLIFGAWLLLPGVALLAWACLGWLTQLDRV